MFLFDVHVDCGPSDRQIKVNHEGWKLKNRLNFLAKELSKYLWYKQELQETGKITMREPKKPFFKSLFSKTKPVENKVIRKPLTEESILATAKFLMRHYNKAEKKFNEFNALNPAWDNLY